MNILLTITDNYTPWCGVTLTSLFENNDASFTIYIINPGIQETNQRKLQAIVQKYGHSIHFLTITNEQKGLIEKVHQVSSYHESVLYRLFVAELIDEKITEILYLDCDLIVKGSLSEMPHIKKDIALYAVPDLFRMNDYHRLEIDHTLHTYFNSGVLYINLEYWRQHDIGRKCLHYIYHHKSIIWLPDQDALNAVLQRKVGYLHPRYNCMTLFSTKPSYLNNRIWWEDLKKVKEAVNNPVIIHYVGAKPWFKGCDNLPWREEWLSYFKKTEWYETISLGYVNGMRGKIKYFAKRFLSLTLPFIAKKVITDIYEKPQI